LQQCKCDITKGNLRQLSYNNIIIKKVSIIVPETAVIEAVADPHYMFRAVNQFLKQQGKEKLFDIEVIGLKKHIELENNLYTVNVDKTIDEVSETDLIIIPAISGDFGKAIEKNLEYIPWLINHYEKGAELASLCVGSFLLASTGLLSGKKCSSHWVSANQFRAFFPDVELVDYTIITEENGIYSSGGANSYWALLLYLVEKYTNRDTAILAAKFFAIDIDRDNQSRFMMFEGQKNHDDNQVLEVQNIIESNLKDRITVSDLAEKSSLGRRSLERRFKKATNNTVLEYIQRIKIEAAKRSFELSNKNITEVMYDVGYSDNKAFRTTFKKITGMTPIEYRSKYCKE